MLHQPCTALTVPGRPDLGASKPANLPTCTGNPRLCYVAGLDYEVLCGEWSGNKSYRLGGGNRSSNSTHTGLKTGGAAAEEAAPG
jgi:hypothetical protein